MADSLRLGLRTGSIFGVTLIFLVLIGLNATLSELIGRLIGAKVAPGEGSVAGMLVLLALLGLWAGLRAAPRVDPDSWFRALAGGLTAGAVAGAIYGFLLAILGWVQAAGIDLRAYLFQLSPAHVELVLLGLPPPGGLVVSFGLLAAAGLAGAVLARGIARGAVGRRTALAWRSARARLAGHPLVVAAREDRRVRWTLQALCASVLVLPFFLGEYWNNTLGTVGIYMLMGLGLNIVVGLAGLLDLGYVAFFAVGAYTVGLLTAPAPLGLEWNFWLVLPLAVATAALGGVLLGIPVLRLRGDYLAIVTLGFGEIIRILVLSELLAPYLGGPQGIRDIGGPSILGASLISQRAFTYLILVAIGLVILVTVRLQGSRLGRSWIAMREDETVAQATGINVYHTKLLAFAIGAAFAGLGGALFAARNQYTGPEDHVLMVSINVLCLVIVGGMGSIPGIVVGSFVLKGLPEILRPLQDYRLLAFGALLMVMMIVRPQGLWPSRRRKLELKPEVPGGAHTPGGLVDLAGVPESGGGTP